MFQPSEPSATSAFKQLGVEPIKPSNGVRGDSNFWLRAGAAVFLIVCAAAMRLIPHPPNFTPIAGMALFGAAIFKRREMGLILPLVMPLAALFLSDCVLGFHDQIASVYISFLLIAFIGLALRENRSVPRLLAASVSSSVIFFVVTNTAVWFSNPFYAHNFSGLTLCWAAGIPFFENTLMGDLLSTGVLFSVWAMFERALPSDLSAVRA